MLSREFVGWSITCWLILSAMPSFGEEAGPKTSLAIYDVSDLVSHATVTQSVAYAKITPEQWQAEHAGTIESLDRLKTLVNSLCSSKPTAIEPHRETLSLVVRHSATGHEEIEELLKLLRRESQPAIRLTCRPLFNFDSRQLEELSEAKAQRAEALIMRKILTAKEARELQEILQVPTEFAPLNQTVELVVGRKTSWGHEGRPATATARVVPNERSIQLRVDYIIDDIGETLPVAAQVFEVPEGSAAISHHTCDGGTIAWLLTPCIIEPKVADHVEIRTTVKE